MKFLILTVNVMADFVVTEDAIFVAHQSIGVIRKYDHVGIRKEEFEIIIDPKNYDYDGVNLDSSNKKSSKNLWGRKKVRS